MQRFLSGHNNYWLWGPRGATGELMIVVGISKPELEQYFATVEPADTIVSPYAMPHETNLPVYVCSGLRIPMDQAWPAVKRFM